MKRILFSAAVTLIFLASFAAAQNTNMYFNGSTQGDVYCGGSDGCVYTGYYDGSINNVNVGPGQPGGPGMICDDYYDNITSGERWTANGVQVSTLNSSNITQALFGADTFNGYTGVQLYAQLAYVVNQMFTTNPTTAQLSAFSQALWYITGGLTWSSISTAAQAYVTAAINYASGNNFSLSQYTSLWLYTPNPRGPNEAQEMWGMVPVPEGGAALLYLLLAVASCFGAMFFRRQRELAKSNF
jgi:hypothetical protein